MKKESKLNIISDYNFKIMVETSDSVSEIITKLGYKNKSGNIHKYIKTRIDNNNLSLEHMTKLNNGVNRNRITKIPLSEILIENSTYTNRTRLKIRLVNEGILDYKCVKCGNTGEWMGEPITLQLDHKNGINNDNRLENLRFLCPNCHSQTKTFGGKNLN